MTKTLKIVPVLKYYVVTLSDCKLVHFFVKDISPNSQSTKPDDFFQAYFNKELIHVGLNFKS